MNSLSIIALKGPPFTRKTEIARGIRQWMKCPILSLDAILHTLSPHYNASSPPPPHEAERLYDLAFRIVCRVAAGQLQQGVVNHVVIDSPLSTQSHLDLLISLARGARARLLIVECKPENEYGWKMKFENRCFEYAYDNEDGSKWYKPNSWADVERALRDDDVRFDDGDDSKVHRLVLDPGVDLQRMELFVQCDPVLYVMSELFEAIDYMIARDEDHGPLVLKYKEWRSLPRGSPLRPLRPKEPTERTNSGESSGTTGEILCRNGHEIRKYMETGPENQVINCMVCGNRVIGAAYGCGSCSLTLHKACATKANRRRFVLPNGETELPIKETEPFSGIFSYNFIISRPCTCCREDGKEFSRECESCLFESHLKSSQVPTVVKRPGHEHFLSIQLVPVKYNTEVYTCVACGLEGRDMNYFCYTCKSNYHVKCVELDPVKSNEHGGYVHLMKLKYSSEEAEDYLCNVCQELRDPKCWYYSCISCAYEAHTFCV